MRDESQNNKISRTSNARDVSHNISSNRQSRENNEPKIMSNRNSLQNQKKKSKESRRQKTRQELKKYLKELHGLLPNKDTIPEQKPKILAEALKYARKLRHEISELEKMKEKIYHEMMTKNLNSYNMFRQFQQETSNNNTEDKNISVQPPPPYYANQ